MSQPRLERGKLPCPNCSVPLEFSLTALFTGESILCRACGATLEVDPSGNEQSLAALRKAQALVDGVRGDRGRLR